MPIGSSSDCVSYYDSTWHTVYACMYDAMCIHNACSCMILYGYVCVYVCIVMMCSVSMHTVWNMRMWVCMPAMCIDHVDTCTLLSKSNPLIPLHFVFSRSLTHYFRLPFWKEVWAYHMNKNNKNESKWTLMTTKWNTTKWNKNENEITTKLKPIPTWNTSAKRSHVWAYNHNREQEISGVRVQLRVTEGLLLYSFCSSFNLSCCALFYAYGMYAALTQVDSELLSLNLRNGKMISGRTRGCVMQGAYHRLYTLATRAVS